MKHYLLALDEGTTSARAILFDRDSNIISMAQHEIPQIYPQSGWVEQNPLDIYANQYASLTECVAKSAVDPNDIAAIGITNQRETTIVWEKSTGKPIYHAIVWQCRRTSDICRKLEKDGYADTIRKATGLRIDPYFSGTKIQWILDHVPGAREKAENGELLFGTVDTWLLWKLTDGKVFVTDRTNASRTMLYNIHEDRWDETILRILRIPLSMLPEIRSSSEVYGVIHCMGASIPVTGIAGDQQAALFGQGCFEEGRVKNTYGTGCFLLAHTGQHAVESRNGLLTTVAASEAGQPMEYALEGSVFVGGAVIQWLRDELRMIAEARDSEYFASKVPDTGGVYIVPAFSGLGAPYWDSEARGSIVGLSRGTTRNHLIRAALESIVYQTQDVLAAMQADMRQGSESSTGSPAIDCLRVDGGASANRLLLQMQSDVSGLPVERSRLTEATAAGAAYLAGLAVGFYRDRSELPIGAKEGFRFEPKTDEATRSQRLSLWHRAIRSCRAFTADNPDVSSSKQA